jgi:uncharacterized membrane protein YqaE (UPF0057 family)
MKQFLFVFSSFICLLISSCKTGEISFSIGKIEKRRYMNGYSFHFKQQKTKNQEDDILISKEVTTNTTNQLLTSTSKKSDIESIRTLEKSIEPSNQLTDVNSNLQIVSSNCVGVTSIGEKSIKQIVTNEREVKHNLFTRKLLRKLKSKKVSSRSSGVDLTADQILGIILSLIFPPLGVFIFTGFDLKKTLIALILTLIFWIPGLVYALLVIFDKI